MNWKRFRGESFNRLPLEKDVVLDYEGLTQEEFYNRYLVDGKVELDKEDVKELMSLMVEVSFDKNRD